jgi:hypothetical protein
MHQSSPLALGGDVHQASIAVAYIAQDHEAAVIDLGPMGTRHVDLETRGRTRPATAQPLSVVSDAGPCGAWRSRYLRTTGSVCWVVAPALSPHQAGDRVKTDRRHAVHWARLRRAGDRTPGDVPPVEEAASRALCRARAEASAALQAAPWRRHASRSTGQAPWGPAHLRWLSAVGWPGPAQHLVFQA